MTREITRADWERFFPFPSIRPEQEQALNYFIGQVVNEPSRKFFVLDAGTGIGKSAIGVTLANFINDYVQIAAGFTPGAYVLTTQKLLTEQYIRDFGPGKGTMVSLKSSTNYVCNFYPTQSCAESKQALTKLGKSVTSDFARMCKSACVYTQAKSDFINSPLSCTNYSYFLAETQYSGKLKPRSLIIADECHSLEAEFSKFIEVTYSERFAKVMLKVAAPQKSGQEEVLKWVKKVYKPALRAHVKELEKELEEVYEENDMGRDAKSKQFDLLDKHLCKVNRFLTSYTPENWVMTVVEPNNFGKGGRKSTGERRFEFKPIEVAPYAQDLLYKHGERIMLMSATIIDKEIFCKTVGIDPSQAAFMHLESPFPIKNRPIHYLPVGKMSYGEIDKTLPKMVEVLEEILEQHKGQKGVLHCLDEDSPVQLIDGSLKAISALRVGDKVISWNEVQKQWEPQRVLAVIDNGARECIELKFDSGEILTCTPDHKILTLNRGWVEAQELLDTDELSIV